MIFKAMLCVLFILRITASLASPPDTIRLFFGINQSSLTQAHKVTLDSLGGFLTDTTAVYIEGFADYLGNKTANYVLSKIRANTVKDYLSIRHNKNVNMVAVGRGQVDASMMNTAPSGEPLNRRVDITVVKTTVRSASAIKPIPKDKIGTLLSEQPPLTGKTDDSVYARIADLPKLKIGDSLSFKEFTFKPGRHFLRQAAIHYMVALKDCLKANPTLKIEIQGHICCQYDGKDGLDFDTNKSNLSLSRAKYIYDYLTAEGVDANRLRYKVWEARNQRYFLN
jgi:outer membrane protein OmpA-like peptidoglycan-associated protein